MGSAGVQYLRRRWFISEIEQARLCVYDVANFDRNFHEYNFVVFFVIVLGAVNAARTGPKTAEELGRKCNQLRGDRILNRSSYNDSRS